MSDQPAPTIADRIWIGSRYEQGRTLVLGESYFESQIPPAKPVA